MFYTYFFYDFVDRPGVMLQGGSGCLSMQSISLCSIEQSKCLLLALNFLCQPLQAARCTVTRSLRIDADFLVKIEPKRTEPHNCAYVKFSLC